MLLGDGPAVADPGADDVRRERFLQFRLPRRPQVLEQLGPRVQAGLGDDALQLRPQVRIRVPVAGDDILRPRLGFVERGFQVRAQLREDGHDSLFAAGMMFRLGRVNGEPGALPVDVPPPQSKMLRWATQSAEPGEREQQPPLRVRAGRQHGRGVGPRDEVHPLPHGQHAPFQVRERIARDDPLADGRPEELLGVGAPPADRVRRQLLLHQVEPPFVRVAGRDFPQRLAGPEELDQVPPRVPVGRGRRFLHVGPLGDVGIEPRSQRRGGVLPRLRQPDRDQLIEQFPVPLRKPLACIVRRGVAVRRRAGQVFDVDANGLRGPHRNLPEADALSLAVRRDEQNPPPAGPLVGRDGSHELPAFLGEIPFAVRRGPLAGCDMQVQERGE
ncbi:MAG: hypothetical protein WED34_11820, partial [Planctomycetales bacterium]